ncbi:unnamed protein product [Brachionus calyciflorus]|uniref:Peroxin-19 n=1 Tax=Brachionus calyciflorus TaxID=104777 RepID=A0A813R6E7_9BILA|nr:unnamed protein product [Brachionus calyciflorus]
MENNETDKELDDLLDTALEDFDKKLDLNDAPIETKNYTIEKTNILVEEDVDDEDRSKSIPINSSNQFNTDEMKLFEEIFNDEKTRESMKQFKDVLSAFGEQSGNSNQADELLQNLDKVMSQLTSVDDEDDDKLEKDLEFLKKFPQTTQKEPKEKENIQLYEDDIDEEDRKPSSSLFNKVIDDMNKNTEKIFNAGPGGDFFSKLNFGGDDEDADDDLMMEPILSMLFSKDVLYPSLKLMLENYEKYLVEKKSILNESEYEKCSIQKDCVQKMCDIYQNSKESDSKQEKSDQLKQILDLLEKCGMPPTELVPEVNPFDFLGDQGKQNQACPIS